MNYCIIGVGVVWFIFAYSFIMKTLAKGLMSGVKMNVFQWIFITPVILPFMIIRLIKFFIKK